MTLRELTWAADGKQEEAWWREAYLTAIVASAWGGKISDLARLVPERFRPPAPERTPEQKARDTRSAIRLVGSFFKDPNP